MRVAPGLPWPAVEARRGQRWGKKLRMAPPEDQPHFHFFPSLLATRNECGMSTLVGTVPGGRTTAGAVDRARRAPPRLRRPCPPCRRPRRGVGVAGRRGRRRADHSPQVGVAAVGSEAFGGDGAGGTVGAHHSTRVGVAAVDPRWSAGVVRRDGALTTVHGLVPLRLCPRWSAGLTRRGGGALTTARRLAPPRLGPRWSTGVVRRDVWRADHSNRLAPPRSGPRCSASLTRRDGWRADHGTQVGAAAAGSEVVDEGGAAGRVAR